MLITIQYKDGTTNVVDHYDTPDYNSSLIENQLMYEDITVPKFMELYKEYIEDAYEEPKYDEDTYFDRNIVKNIKFFTCIIEHLSFYENNIDNIKSMKITGG